MIQNHYDFCAGAECPLGDISNYTVGMANTMVSRKLLCIDSPELRSPIDACSNNEMLTFNLARTMLVLHLVLWMGGCYILEQPSSSLMKMHPRVKQIFELFGRVAINTFLGPWGHWTAKLTTFFSNQPPALNFANVSAAMPFINKFISILHFASGVGFPTSIAG